MEVSSNAIYWEGIFKNVTLTVIFRRKNMNFESKFGLQKDFAIYFKNENKSSEGEGWL